MHRAQGEHSIIEVFEPLDTDRDVLPRGLEGIPKVDPALASAIDQRCVPEPTRGAHLELWREQETVDGCLRQLDFCESEIAAIEKAVAAEALRSAEIRRLMTVPGVNVICAATFMAAVGDIRRFGDRRKLAGHLGLDLDDAPAGLDQGVSTR